MDPGICFPAKPAKTQEISGREFHFIEGSFLGKISKRNPIMYTETAKTDPVQGFPDECERSRGYSFFIESKNVPPDRRSQISYKTDVICPVTFISSSV